jgi:phospholipase/carboxylesterase
MPALIDGPRIKAASGQAKQLVVFLHGYGADGNDLIEIGRQWQGLLPDAAFVSPHAPSPCGMSPMGREWFPLTFRDPHERWRGVNAAHPVLEAFLDAELQSLGLTSKQLALVGFSQGCMMALHAGLRRKTAPAAILGLSGMLVLPEGQGPEALIDQNLAKPPVLLTHGGADEVIPVDALFMSADALGAADIPCQWHLSPQMGHSIDEECLRQGGLFLMQNFGLALPKPRKTA